MVDTGRAAVDANRHRDDYAIVEPAVHVRPLPVVLRRFVRDRLAIAGLVGLVVIVLAVALGGRLWRYGYAEITDDVASSPSWRHPMGTDAVTGHDLLAQVLRGSQRSLQVALLVALVSTAVGVAIGAAAGYARGVLDTVLMRLTDVVLIVPVIAVLAVLAGSARTRSWVFVGLILAALTWPRKARLVRATFVSLREQAFVEAARAAGAGGLRVIWRHLLPNAAAPIIVAATLSVASAILGEAALSFLGLGISPPDTSLGRLVATGQPAVTTRPWLFYFPGLTIAVMVLSVNFVGEALRRALDPRDLPVLTASHGVAAGQ